MAVENFLIKNKIKYCFVDSGLYDRATSEFYETNPVLARTMPTVRHNMWDIMLAHPDKQYMLYGGHFDEHIHKIFANQIE